MRLLRVAQKLYPDVTGGGPYHVHAMSRDQAAMGHDVTVLTVRSDRSLPDREERDGYTIRRFDPQFSPLGNDLSVGLAKFLHRADDFDVIHAHSHLYFATNLAALKRRLGGTPLAITNHGLMSQTAPEWVFELYLKSLGRWTFNCADAVFCYTETDKQRVREYGVSAPIEVVPNGIDTERFTPTGPESELLEHDGTTVLFVGRLVEGKRPGDAIEAIDSLPEDIALYLCGNGPLREELESEAGDRCTFLGSLPYEEMPAVYRAADLLVLPSRAEGTPRTVMEALASGVPVVSSDLPHVRSAFGDRVSYFECGDVEGLVGAVESALASESAGELDDQFRWSQTVEETTACLEGLVEDA